MDNEDLSVEKDQGDKLDQVDSNKQQSNEGNNSEKNFINKPVLYVLGGIFLITLLVYGGGEFFKWVFPVKGSGNVTTESREVDEFKKIKLEGQGEIILEKGSEESLEIEAEDNLLKYLSTNVSGDTLKIRPTRFSRRLKPTEPIKFKITVVEIEDIVISGSGALKGDDINSEDLTIKVSGDGDVDLEDMNVEELYTKVSGSAQFKLSGKAKSHEIDINGSGVNEAEDLEVDECDIEVNGSGDVKVNVKEKLKVQINGSGRVYYKGNPDDFDQKINGSGEVKKLE